VPHIVAHEVPIKTGKEGTYRGRYKCIFSGINKPSGAAQQSRAHLLNHLRDVEMVNLHASSGANATTRSSKHSFTGGRHFERDGSNLSNSASHRLLDGLGDYSHTQPKPQRNNFMQPILSHAEPQQQVQSFPRQGFSRTASQVRPRKLLHLPDSAVTDILPYCTTEPPLRQEQIIALSDIAGSVKELVLLALGAEAGDAVCAGKMEGAVGAETTGSIVEFFAAEWEVE
jgi:hypothetical protein